MNYKPPGLLAALLGLNCPQCRKEKLFLHGPYSGKHLKMSETCPNCGLKYEIEPGFFWGAMYVTYALISAIFVGFLIAYFVFELKWWQVAIGYVGTVILLIPVLVRYARAIMLYAFGSIRFRKELYDKR